MENVVLLLGSNQGDREQLLKHAAELLEQRIGRIALRTEMLSSPPFGFSSDNEFLNQGLVIATALDPMAIMLINQEIETTMGRNHATRLYDLDGKRIYHDRPIDIDILYYGSQTINTPSLVIPHPRINERPFVIEILRRLCW